MKNIVVDYRDIVNTIAKQFYLIKPADISLVIEDEQSWNKEKDRDPNAVYIVVRFGDASTNFGQAVVPVTLEVLSIQNEIEETQALLNQYVTEYNRLQTGDTTQLYLTPTVNLRFNQVYEGFRSLLTVSGTFLIANSTIRLAYLRYYYGDGEDDYEDIEVIAYNDITENSLNPQPYFNTKGRTKSYGSFQTFAFSIVTYPDGNKKLIQKIMKMKFDMTESHQNDEFNFVFKFSNMDLDYENSSDHSAVDTTSTLSFKCRSAEFNQKIGDIPVITLGFSL